MSSICVLPRERWVTVDMSNCVKNTRACLPFTVVKISLHSCEFNRMLLDIQTNGKHTVNIYMALMFV